jgi:hypothetical protein
MIPAITLVAAAILVSSAPAGAAPMAPHASPGGGTLGSTSTSSGLNAVIPAFKVGFAWNGLGTRRRLTKVLIRPFMRGATAIGGCDGCFGDGHFSVAKREGRYLAAVVGGHYRFRAHTRLVIGLIRGHGIGRFRVYAVTFNPLGLQLVTQGCLASDTVSLGNGKTSQALLNDLLRPASLPQVPCAAKVPTGDHGTLYAPLELSASSAQTGRLVGSVAGDRSLTIFRAHRACAPDPIAESVRALGDSMQVFSVRGHFTQRFAAGTDSEPGYYCIYLQTAGKFRGIPTGRVTAMRQQRYLGGDSLTLTAPSFVIGGQPAQPSVAGTTAVKERVWLFASHAACAPTAEAEYPQQFAMVSKIVDGVYNVPLALGVLSQSANVCAYLQLQTSSTRPAGSTLLAQAQTVVVASGTVSLSGATTVAHDQSLVTGVSGTTSTADTLWNFTSFSPCAATAAAEYSAKYGFNDTAVNGPYSLTLTSPTITPAQSPLYRCAYLQLGTALNAPMIAAASQTITEEYILVPKPANISSGQTTVFNFSGVAATPETVWIFRALQPCAADAQTEYNEAAGFYNQGVSPGAFSGQVHTVTLTQTGQEYVCAYLQTGSGTASNGTPLGSVVDTNFNVFNVS